MTEHAHSVEYYQSLESGLEYEDFVVDVFYGLGMPLVGLSSRKAQGRGENRAGFEIKNDKKFRKTGNLYIETAERHRTDQEFWPSGIFRADNTWAYAIGDRQTIYVFAKRHLIAAYERLGEDGSPKYERNGNPTSEGFLYPIRDHKTKRPIAERTAARVLRLTSRGWVCSVAAERDAALSRAFQREAAE